MCSKVITTLGIIVSMLGTVFTLWTTFITKNAGTYAELANRHIEFPKEQKRVKLGCALITFGGFLQIIGLYI